MTYSIWAKRYIDSSLKIDFQDSPTLDWVVCCYYWEKAVAIADGANEPVSSSKTKDRLVIEINPKATLEDMRKLIDAYQSFDEKGFKPHRCIIYNLERLVKKEETELYFECNPK